MSPLVAAFTHGPKVASKGITRMASPRENRSRIYGDGIRLVEDVLSSDAIVGAKSGSPQESEGPSSALR